MGKRKERRLAAKIASGRRVKLDLLDEPTGELPTSSSIHAESGVNLDQEERAGVPSSPSSGQKQDNPLLLLGQYSDDEVNHNPIKGHKLLTFEENSSLDTVDKVDENVGHHDDSHDTSDSYKDAVSSNDKSEVEQLGTESNINRKENEESGIVTGVDASRETYSIDKTCNPDASGMQVVGDASGEWKIVAHEESNGYYYWNTVTGETSWEVPAVLAQSFGTSTQPTASMLPDPSIGSSTYTINVIADSGICAVSKSTPEYFSGVAAGHENVESLNMVYDASQIITNFSTSDFCARQCEEDRSNHSNLEPYFATDVDVAQLVMQCESLLKKMKELKWFDWISKYVTEVEIRLLDCSVLSSFGSSILPFWCHTKTQLDRIEFVIEKAISDNVKSEDIKKVDGEEYSTLLERSEYMEMDNKISTNSEKVQPCHTDVENRNEKDKSQSPTGNCTQNEKNHSSPTFQISLGVTEGTEPSLSPSKPVLEVDYNGHQEIDMDVEMEVDEEIPISHHSAAGSLPTEYFYPLEKPNLTSEPDAPFPSNDLNAPSPSGEEWIPPPPSDAEPIPPLPPEEPPSDPPPPCAETSPSLPYVDQYNLDYSDPTFHYFNAAAGDAQGTDNYPHTNVGQVEPQPVQYYQPVASCSCTSAVATIPTEAVIYYDPHSGSVPSVPIATSLGVAGVYFDSGLINDDTRKAPLYELGTSGTYNESVSISLPSEKVAHEVVSKLCSASKETEKFHIQANGQLILSEVTTAANTNILDVTSKVPTKNPPKVPRAKKRAVAVATTFRSNKKVTSLVDKWKAAKEELHEDEEEEPEDAYVALEKKRQKEIEEWRARQIASGEAQDNANFLPLGGDWRERVKRRKAQLNVESVETPKEEAAPENKKPDLVELSKGLPSGWQVYWDESSKEVYYGNLYTSETTWTRPSK